MAATQYLTVGHLDRKTLARIFSKISINKTTDCWETSGNRYGSLHYKNRQESAHRLMYAWLVAPIPTGHAARTMQIDHIVCDNKRCCNPSHLALVSARANTLRNDGPTANNAIKTHCPRGHQLPSTKNRPTGRECRECKRIARKRRNTEIMKGPRAAALKAAKQAYDRERRARLRHLTTQNHDGARSPRKTNNGEMQ